MLDRMQGGKVRPRTLWLWLGVAFSVGLLATIGGFAAPRVVSAERLEGIACAAPEYSQFDFWVGDWEAFEAGSTHKVARVRVDRILDGCVLREEYEGADGLKGRSLSTYDVSTQTWQQAWMTNRGHLLGLEGKLQAGAMVLSGKYRTTAGRVILVRGTWRPEGNGVRETALRSTDGGKSWKPWFDLSFRHVSGAENKMSTIESDDAKIVAALDTEYQAAVQRNDADTMDRILAADFTLVTGLGKTYSKADLLNEARSGRIIYERQDDSEQTVRLWGETAVVTAKLRAKGTENGKPFDYTLWFSDTYVRTAAGWRYVFGQASSRLPQNP